MSKIRIGLVGFGYMGKMHSLCYENLKYYYQLPKDVEIELYALAAPRPVTDLPVKFTKVYKNYADLIADDNVDVVDICAPNFMHKEVLLAAIKANKYIYCEKPLTLNLEEAKEIRTAIETTNYQKTNRVAFEYRFCPAIIRAHELIKDGKIGKLVQFNFKYYGSEFLNPLRPITWQSTKAKSGGGVLYALGTHAIDLIRYLVGEVESVYALQKTVFKERPIKDTNEISKVEIEDILNVLLECEQDIPGTLLLSQVAAGAGIDFAFEIYGEHGSLKFSQENPNALYYYDDGDAKEPHGGFAGYKAIETMQKYDGAAIFPPPRVNIAWSRYHVASVYDFINSIVNKKNTSPNLMDAFKVQVITDAIYASAQQHKMMLVNKLTGRE